MTAVQDRAGNIIELRNCECGAEPTYWSKTGLAHEIVCTECGRQTDMKICGKDAVYEWNHGKVYPSAEACPIRSKFR